jgi:PAS domain S-box-containing protein
LADSGQALIWTCGIDQKCDYFNSPWLIFTGRTLAEELNDGWLEEIHPDDRSYRKQTFDNAFNSRTRFCIDYRLRSANGSYHWVQENGSPRFNFDDEFIGYIGHCMDITQRKENEESLKVSEFRYRELLEKISLVAVILDLKGDIVFCNEQTLKLTGYSLDELIGQNWFDLILPAESRTVKKVFIEGIRTGKVEERFENPIITKSGKKRDIKWSNVIQRNSNNEITGIAGVGEDITEQRKAEAAIKNKDHLIFRTGKMAKVGGWEFEVKTGKGSWTDEVASIHGLDPNIETNSSIGLSFYEEEYRKKIEEAIEKAVTEQKPYDLELKMTDAKGNQKWVRTIGIPVVAEGITVKLQGTFQDITELKKTEDSLQKLNIELEQRVQSRTTELEQKNADLERMNKLFVGRELRMIELKNQIDELKSMLEKK